MVNQDNHKGRPIEGQQRAKDVPSNRTEPPVGSSGGQPFLNLRTPAGPASRSAEGPASINLFELKPELFQIPMDDDPKLQPAQQRVLRQVAHRVFAALVQLSETREAAARTESSPQQRFHHAADFLESFPQNLIQRSCGDAQLVGLDLSNIDKAIVEFGHEYLSRSCSDGSTPIPAGLIGKACSILQSVMYPALPLEADMVLMRVEKGFRSLESRGRDGYGMFGTRLAWSMVLMQPDILKPNAQDQSHALLEPKLVHRLAMVPLHQSVGQVTNTTALRKLGRFMARLPPGSGNDGPWQKDLQVFSKIFHLPIHTQPFYEGNHRAGWILANQWLLRNCGAYIPWDQDLSDQLKDISASKGREFSYTPKFIASILRSRHEERAAVTFSEILEAKVHLVTDL